MKRRRYIRDGYDLDLSYITDRVVAMSYPAESLEAMFRNPMWQVQRFLSANHAHHFKVYNLCAEQWYDPSYFGGRVERFPFDDHGVPALELVRALCESAQDWLDRCHDNIIVVHCKAGKGRTGVMVCCLLLLAGMTTDDALALYADRRTLNRAGVTIPSQVRYVRYWARLVADAHLNAAPITLPPPTRRTIQRVRVYGMTGLDRVDFVICTLDEVPLSCRAPHHALLGFLACSSCVLRCTVGFLCATAAAYGWDRVKEQLWESIAYQGCCCAMRVFGVRGRRTRSGTVRQWSGAGGHVRRCAWAW
ncbi:unnamed protein product [Closterium sp. NIES-54]